MCSHSDVSSDMSLYSLGSDSSEDGATNIIFHEYPEAAELAAISSVSNRPRLLDIFLSAPSPYSLEEFLMWVIVSCVNCGRRKRICPSLEGSFPWMCETCTVDIYDYQYPGW